ncbi:MAG: phosphate uptake regulator PhoU [Nanoarchaeota archaeon]
MEYRKLIKFGKNSFVVSLPKAWITKHGLEKSNIVHLHVNANSIILSPERLAGQIENKEATLDVREDSINTIKRKIISHYINNFKTINVIFDTNDKAQQVRSIVHNLMALEIIEQTKSTIVAKDYLNMDDISIPGLVRKNDNIIRSMFKDLNSSLQDDNFFSNVELCDNINSRDEDVNRLTFVIMRAVKHQINHPPAKKEEDDFQIFYGYELAQYLERLGDEIKRLVRVFASIEMQKHQNIKDAIVEIEQLYLQCMKAYYLRNIEMAYKIADARQAINENIRTIAEGHKDNPHILRICERSHGIVRNIHSITRLVYQ